jgi:hypothetical protein
MRTYGLILQLVLLWVMSLIRPEVSRSVGSPGPNSLPGSQSPQNRYRVPLFH